MTGITSGKQGETSLQMAVQGDFSRFLWIQIQIQIYRYIDIYSLYLVSIVYFTSSILSILLHSAGVVTIAFYCCCKCTFMHVTNENLQT